jgi:hypothetical protein
MSTLVRDDKNILQHVWSYKLYVSHNIYPFCADLENCLILSWSKISDQIGNASPLFRGLSFLLLDYVAHSVCHTESDVPNSEID